jgi:hypothetical protein
MAFIARGAGSRFGRVRSGGRVPAARGAVVGAVGDLVDLRRTAPAMRLSRDGPVAGLALSSPVFRASRGRGARRQLRVASVRRARARFPAVLTARAARPVPDAVLRAARPARLAAARAVEGAVLLPVGDLRAGVARPAARCVGPRPALARPVLERRDPAAARRAAAFARPAAGRPAVGFPAALLPTPIRDAFAAARCRADGRAVAAGFRPDPAGFAEAGRRPPAGRAAAARRAPDPAAGRLAADLVPVAVVARPPPVARRLVVAGRPPPRIDATVSLARRRFIALWAMTPAPAAAVPPPSSTAATTGPPTMYATAPPSATRGAPAHPASLVAGTPSAFVAAVFFSAGSFGAASAPALVGAGAGASANSGGAAFSAVIRPRYPAER